MKDFAVVEYGVTINLGQRTLIETDTELYIENIGFLTDLSYREILRIDKRKHHHVVLKVEEKGGLYPLKLQVLQSIDEAKLSEKELQVVALQQIGEIKWRDFASHDLKGGQLQYVYLGPLVSMALVRVQSLPPPSGPSERATVNATARSIPGPPEYPRDAF